MYIISRLNHLMINSDIDSANYIIAAYFLSHANDHRGMTLNTISKETFIPVTTLSRFIRSGGYTNLREFLNYLHEESTEMLNARKEFRLMKPADLESCNQLLRNVMPMLKKTAEILSHSRRVFFYGNFSNIKHLTSLMEQLESRGIPCVILDDWKFTDLEKKFDSMSAEDCFVFVNINVSYSFVKYSLEVKEGMIGYSRMAACQAKKIFICAKSGYIEIDDEILEIPETAAQSGYISYVLESMGGLIGKELK